MITNLYFSSISEDMIEVLPMFTNLTELYLDWETTDPTEDQYRKLVECIPSGLQKLTLKGHVASTDTDLPQLFQRLSPTLEILELEVTYPNVDDSDVEIDVDGIEIGLDQLTNIKEFTCPEISDAFISFAEKNRHSMTRLDIGLRRHHDIWENVAAMENLKMFKVCIEIDPYDNLSFEWESPYRRRRTPRETKGLSRVGSTALPCLEELHIIRKDHYDDDSDDYFGIGMDQDGDEEDQESILDFLKALDGSQLQIFYFEAGPREIEMSIFERMRNLVKLSLENIMGSRGVEWPAMVPGLLVLTKLEELAVGGLREHEFLPLIKGLPKLVEISNYNRRTAVDYSDYTLIAAREYLRGVKRELRFNYKMLP